MKTLFFIGFFTILFFKVDVIYGQAFVATAFYKSASVVKAIAAGGIWQCALLTNGKVKCSGFNGTGQLGNGTSTSSNVPVLTSGINNGAVVASGQVLSSHTCSVLATGEAKCWGTNNYGQLGIPIAAPYMSNVPVTVTGLASGVQSIAVGAGHTCALLTTGAVKCWGRNTAGQLGNGGTVDSSSPVNVTGLAAGVKAISLGNYHSCALLTTGGVKCWGYNRNGMIGNGTYTPVSSSVGEVNPVNVTGLAAGVAAIALGAYHSCALMEAGSVKCWGSNNAGQIGTLAVTPIPMTFPTVAIVALTPVDVPGLMAGVTAIAGGNSHTCAVASGGVKCLGSNYYGELGNGTLVNSAVPVAVSGLAAGVKEVTAGNHSCGLLLNGKVKCWGRNDFGEFGIGTSSNTSVPVNTTF